jgi:hypothetical protein
MYSDGEGDDSFHLGGEETGEAEETGEESDYLHAEGGGGWVGDGGGEDVYGSMSMEMQGEMSAAEDQILRRSGLIGGGGNGWNEGNGGNGGKGGDGGDGETVYEGCDEIRRVGSFRDERMDTSSVYSEAAMYAEIAAARAACEGASVGGGGGGGRGGRGGRGGARGGGGKPPPLEF